MWLTILWQNKRLIAELVGLVLAVIVCWWFFIHNPAVIDALEEDKKELNRQVVALEKCAVLLEEIEKGKRGINIETFRQISSIRANAIPHRTVLIRNGVLQTMR